MEGSEALARRHQLLETLRGLRPFIPEYVKYTFTVDVATRQVPEHLRLWTFARPDGSPPPIVSSLLKYDVAGPDWMDTEFGMLGLKAARE